MSVFNTFTDGLRSVVAGLGVLGRDKAAGAEYHAEVLNDYQIVSAYRSSWVAAKIIDIPVEDAFRKWRAWQGEQKQITALETLENKLGVVGKLIECYTKARLYGGAAIYIGTDQDPGEPLNLSRVKKDGVRYLTVFDRNELTAGPLEDDPLAENYGRPTYYTIANSKVDTKIHYSHLVLLVGKPHPNVWLNTGSNHGWGDSVLQSTCDAVKNADSTAANIASLVFEANVDVFGVPDFMNNLADKSYENKIIERFQLAATSKSINKALVHDANEEYDRKQINFQSLPEILQSFLLLVCGAADIPLTRFLGQSAKGLNNDGSGDLKNYYDKVQAIQTLRIEPAISVLDECLIRSALGTRPDELSYNWNPLFQLSETEIANIGKTTAETVERLITIGLYKPEVLREVTTNQLVQTGVFPGLDNLVTESEPNFGFGDAAPRTLYVHRPVVNADDIIEWAKGQGFESTLDATDLHVAIAFSRAPVDWMEVGEAWNSELKLSAGGPRLIEQFDGGATVLLFNSVELTWRHESIIDIGASWDWPEYQPHITISYNAGDLDLSEVEPYQGEIILGPEVFSEINEK